MKASEKKKLFLSNLFLHLDGIALIPTVLELERKKIISNFKNSKLSDLKKEHNTNKAYLNVALRLLCSQGILFQKISKNHEVYYQKSTKSETLNQMISTYHLVSDLYLNKINYSTLYSQSSKTAVSQSILFKILKKYIYKYNTKHKLSIYEKHVEGAMIGPIIVTLAQKGCFSNISKNHKKWWLQLNKYWQKIIQELFICTKIINENHDITEYGLFILKRATSYGVTVSYLPTFKNIGNLLYGDYKSLWTKIGEVETHVDRSMNVWGSGGAHNTYFKKIDEIIIDLFNLPINKQPKGFIDIGCGNGKLIEHIFDLIYYKTIRGKLLDKHPLFIVGSDFNHKALEETKKTINKADIWAQTAFGDISDPQSLAKRLKKEHEIKLEELLNIRSFLDHNRIYSEPKKTKLNKSKSTGAFCTKANILTTIFYNRI